MSENGLMTLCGTAAQLGVHRKTIADMVEILGITPKPMTNGKAKGLDAKDRKLIAERLRRLPRRRPQPSGA